MNLKKRKKEHDPLFKKTNTEKREKQSSMMSFFHSKSANQATITTKFNKQKWIQGLTEDQKELLKLEIESLHESWLNLKAFLKQEKKIHTIFPPDKDIYSWSHYTPLDTVKVVILGQDPYHNYNQAHGLCFSVCPPTPPPPSLKNIFIALQNDYASFNIPKNGLLTPWAKRGVLLLNSSLTVRAHQAGSHAQKGWEEFTDKVIQAVQKNRVNGVVFLAWGSPAAKRVENVDKNIHLVLKSVHPSPLSASKGFFNCGHFKKTNEWLSKRYGDDGTINWNCLSTEQVNSSTIPIPLLENYTKSTTTTPKTHSDFQAKKINQEEKKTSVSLSQEELAAIESSITLEELNEDLSIDHSDSNEE
ncbi:hypothetical protein PMAC_002527 [Pneumocystis sp. 'macacae']|nr:hypothetical protein PMAC_002527 [Pneumocystis sp. 'macacae']